MREIFAHDWNILGDDRIRRWPSKIGEKRGLTIDIRTWAGLSIGAKHIDIQISEQKNMWWCEDKNAWVELTCDAENTGYEFDAKVLSVDEAIRMAVFIVELIAGKESKSHEVKLGSIIDAGLRLKLKNAIPAITNYYPDEPDAEEKSYKLKTPGRADEGGLRSYVTKRQVKQ